MADNTIPAVSKTKKKHTVQYDRWGYFFIAPFFLIYIIFSLIPLLTTFGYSFLEYYRDGLDIIGPNATVARYFTGQEEYYSWQIDEAEIALDELAANYDISDKATADLENEILSTVTSIAEDISVKKYEKKVTKIVKKGVKSGTPAVIVINSAKEQLRARQASLTRNFETVFASGDNMGKYFWNTLVIWLIGFIPQIIISLMLAVWFTNTELRLKGQQFFKTVIYLPNLIMAAAFAMLFLAILSPNGPVNNILKGIYNNMNEAQIASGELPPYEPIRFFSSTGWTRAIVGVMNFLMWYGNTTILLMAGVMGIDNSLFEAARIDGANAMTIFFKITIPLLLPIFVYVLITSLIGGIQMFDVPQILTNGMGTPNRSTMTIIMKLNKHLANKNYGPAGVTSILIFAITGILSGIVYKMTMKNYQNKR